jgi:HEPN domain-containing protein
MAGKRRAEATRWFQQALHDLRAVRWNIDGEFHSTACFLAQQAAEKALKSLLYYLGSRRTALMTHSLVEMLGVAGKAVPDLAPLLVMARELDLHYIPSRYPNGLPGGFPHQFYSQEVAERALASASDIISAVRAFYQAHAETDIVEGRLP